MAELVLKKFNADILEKKRTHGHSPTICLLGRRGSGKSTICVDLLYHLRNIPAIIVFSATEESNGTFGKHIHNLFIYNKFDPEVLKNILNRQKKLVKDLKKKGEDPVNHPEIGICIVLDDMNYDPRLMKDETIKEIFLNGRWAHCSLILSFQYLMSIPPIFRTNIDFVFVCRETKADNIKRLYDYFFGMFDNIADFKKVLMNCTNNYGCLVMDTTCVAKADKIEDQIFWYKAKTDLSFKIGSEASWKKWDKLTNKEEEKEEVKPQSTKIKSDLIVKKIGPVILEE